MSGFFSLGSIFFFRLDGVLFSSLHFTLYLCTCPLFLSGLWSASKTIFRQFLSKLSFHFYSFRFFFLDCSTYISLGASGDLEHFLITFITHHSFSGMREQLTHTQCAAARISMLRLLMQRGVHPQTATHIPIGYLGRQPMYN